MTSTFELLKESHAKPTTDIDHLIIQMAILARASQKEYGLTLDQMQKLYDRFKKIHDAYPEISQRVLEVRKNDQEPFWSIPSDTVLKYLHNAGILSDSIGL